MYRYLSLTFGTTNKIAIKILHVRQFPPDLHLHLHISVIIILFKTVHAYPQPP